jgi:hypothetical protein
MSARRSEADWHQEGAYLKAIRNRRATQPPAHFHRNPPGRGQLAVFPRCSLLTYQVKIRSSILPVRPRTALKNSQLTGSETYTYFGDRTLPLHPAPEWCWPRVSLPSRRSQVAFPERFIYWMPLTIRNCFMRRHARSASQITPAWSARTSSSQR